MKVEGEEEVVLTIERDTRVCPGAQHLEMHPIRDCRTPRDKS